MEKTTLTKQLAEAKKQLRENSTDERLFEKLFDEALSLKGQMCVEPLVLDCGREEDEWSGDTFRITLTDKGVLYHEYGGYSVFTTPRHLALYEVLADLVKNKKKYDSLEGEEKDNLRFILAVITYNLSLPRISFLDRDFALEMADKTCGFINEMCDNLMKQELQEETTEEDEAFKDSAMAIEDVKQKLTKE